MKVTDLSNVKEHPFYLLGDRVAEICKPLFDNFSINHFCYVVLYPENKECVVLTSDKNWTCHFAQNHNDLLFTGEKIHSWSSVMVPEALDDARKFNHYNGIFLEKVRSDCIETLEFSSPSQYSSPLKFCSDNGLLNQFFLYFKEKADQFIKIVEKAPLCFPESRFSNLDITFGQCYSSYCADFYKDTNTRKVSFKFKSREVFFSRREFDVLSLLAKGKSMAEAAEILQISRRTVETYLYKAKDKTDTFSVNNLLDNFTESLF